MTYIRWLLFFYIPYRFAWFGAYIEQTGPPLLILNAPLMRLGSRNVQGSRRFAGGFTLLLLKNVTRQAFQPHAESQIERWSCAGNLLGFLSNPELRKMRKKRVSTKVVKQKRAMSFWDKFDTLVQRQPAVQKCSKLLPAKPPFQQVGKSCKDLHLATPAFAHRDTYRKIEKSSTCFLQIQTEKTCWVLEAWKVFVNASPAEPQLACHAKQPLGLPEITFKIFDDSCHCAKSPLAMQLGQRCSICEPNTWNQFYNLQTHLHCRGGATENWQNDTTHLLPQEQAQVSATVKGDGLQPPVKRDEEVGGHAYGREKDASPRLIGATDIVWPLPNSPFISSAPFTHAPSDTGYRLFILVLPLLQFP